MWFTHDCVYRVETVKGDFVVVAVGIKPDMDSVGDCGVDHRFSCAEVINGTNRAD